MPSRLSPSPSAVATRLTPKVETLLRGFWSGLAAPAFIIDPPAMPVRRIVRTRYTRPLPNGLEDSWVKVGEGLRRTLDAHAHGQASR